MLNSPEHAVHWQLNGVVDCTEHEYCIDGDADRRSDHDKPANIQAHLHVDVVRHAAAEDDQRSAKPLVEAL